MPAPPMLIMPMDFRRKSFRCKQAGADQGAGGADVSLQSALNMTWPKTMGSRISSSRDGPITGRMA
jgi:hypothetical protein